MSKVSNVLTMIELLNTGRKYSIKELLITPSTLVSVGFTKCEKYLHIKAIITITTKMPKINILINPIYNYLYNYILS